MAREKEGFRDALVRLDQAFPNKELLNKKEVKEFLGISYDFLQRLDYPFKHHYISKVALARHLC